jgi:hypothetical protein
MDQPQPRNYRAYDMFCFSACFRRGIAPLLVCATLLWGFVPRSPAQTPGGPGSPRIPEVITPPADALPMSDLSAVRRYISGPVFADDLLAVGAVADVPGMVGQYPLVLIWEKDGSRFTQTQALPTELTLESGFGSALAMNSNTLAVGAPAASVGTTPRGGRVIIYYRPSPDEPFYQVQELTSPTPRTDGSFGASITFCGDRLLVGAPREQATPEGSVLSKGAVYVYEPAETASAGSWQLRTRLVADAGESSRAFGRVLAGVDGIAAVADPAASDREEPGGLGSVHLLSTADTPEANLKETGRINLKTSSDVVRLQVGSSLAMNGEHLVLSCRVRENEGESTRLPDRLLILDFDPEKVAQKQATITSRQVLTLPGNLKVAGPGSLAIYRDWLSVRAISSTGSKRGEILIYQRDPQLPAGSQWAPRCRLLAPHTAIFGRNAVDFAAFTAFAESQLLTVLSRVRPGDTGEVNTALVSYPVSRLIRRGTEDAVNISDPTTLETQATSRVRESLKIHSVSPRAEPQDDGQLLITRPGQARTDYLGRSLLTTPDFLVAGAPAGEEIGVESGSVLLLPRPVRAGALEAWEIRVSPQLQADDFGRQLAFSNGILAVTAARFGEAAQDFPGAVLFFRLIPGSAPEFLHVLTAPNEHESAAFATSLAMNEENLFIGAPGQSQGGQDFAPKVFHYTGNPQNPADWALQQVLEHPEGEVFSRFGQTLLLAEDLLVIGAPSGLGRRGERTGMVYVYSRHRGGRNAYSLLTRLRGLQAGPQAEFGLGLAYSSNTLWVGAPGEMVRSEDVGIGSIHNRNQGAVYQFRRDYPRVDVWTQVTHLVDPRGHRNQRFGEALLYDPASALLAVGAPGTIAGEEPATAGAVVFWTRQSKLNAKRALEPWRKLGSMTSPRPVAKGLYGVALAQAGEQVFTAAMSTSSSSVQRGGAICAIDARKQTLVPLLTQALERREAARAEEIRRRESLLRAGPEPEQASPEPEDLIDPKEPTAADPDAPVQGRRWELLSAKTGGYTRYQSPPQAPGLLQSSQISPLAGGVLLQRPEAGDVDLPRYLALQADGILTPYAREILLAEPRETGNAPTGPSPLDSAAPVLTSSGKRIALARPGAAAIDLLFLNNSERGGWPAQWEQLQPGQARGGFGSHLAFSEELVAVGDNTGTNLYRLAAPAGQVTGIFEGRLDFDAAPQGTPTISMARDLLVQAGLSYDGSTQEDVDSRVAVLIYPRRAYGFRNRAKQQVILPLTLGPQPAAADDGRQHHITAQAHGNTVMIAAPAYSQAYLLTREGSGEEWIAALQVGSLAPGPLGRRMVSMGESLLMSSPKPNTIYSFKRAGPRWITEKLVLPTSLTEGGSITGMAFSNHLLWITLQNGSLLSIAAGDIKDYLHPLDPDDLLIEDDPRTLRDLITEATEADREALRSDDPTDQQSRRTWQFTAAPSKASPQFGAAMHCSGKLLLVGDPGVPTKSGGEGGVWVYLRESPSSHNWQLSGLIPNPAAVRDSAFGAALAVSGDERAIAVGAPRGGVAYVFQLAEGSVRMLSTLTAPDEWSRTGEFGTDLAFVDSQLLVSAPSGEFEGARTGTVLLFHPSEDGSGFERSEVLPLPEPLKQAQGARFGQALESRRGIVAVGAPLAKSRTRHGQRNDGSVFLFKKIHDTWELLKELSPTSTIGSDSFGATLAMGDDNLLVGAPAADMLNVNRPGRINDQQGAVHLFSKRGTLDDWIFKKTFSAEPGGNNLLFGTSLAVSGNQILAGAPGALRASGRFTPSRALFTFIKPNDVSDIWRQVPLPDFPPEISPQTIGRAVLLDGTTLYATATLQNQRRGICISPEPGSSPE